MSENLEFLSNNCAVLNLSNVIKPVMSLAAEVEHCTSFLNAKAAVPNQKNTLEEMGHKQPLMPIQTNDLTTNVEVTNQIQPKATMAMDIRLHRLRDHEAQECSSAFTGSLESKIGLTIG